jgi:hypothetical protein
MPLRGRDRVKLLKAGFKIFRREDVRMVIKICNEKNEWCFFKKCTSKKELKEQMDQILEMSLCIEDI